MMEVCHCPVLKHCYVALKDLAVRAIRDFSSYNSTTPLLELMCDSSRTVKEHVVTETD
jgi:hypothetical protein